MLSEFRSTNVTWDKATRRIYAPVTANESDENGRKLVVQVVNGGQVEDLTGVALHLYWSTIDKLHEGLDAFKAVDLKKGIFELSYTTGMLSNKGVLKGNLVLVDSTGRIVSDRFRITVTEGINDDAAQSENSFSSLTQALIDVANLEQKYTPRLNALNDQLRQKASITYVDAILMDIAKGGPRGLFMSLSALNSHDFPDGKEGTWLVFDTTFGEGPHSFIWDSENSLWKDLGVYQANEIADESITHRKYAPKSVGIDKTDFFESTKNLYDYKRSVTGKKINGAGIVVDTVEGDGLTYVTKVENIEPEKDYVINAFAAYSFRSANDTVLLYAVKSAGSPVKSPAGATHLYVSLPVQEGFVGNENIQLEQNTTMTKFVPAAKLSYKPLLEGSDFEEIETKLAPAFKPLHPLGIDNYGYVEYTAVLRNKTNKVYLYRPAYINIEFPFGECLNEKHIKMETQDGENVAFQWEDEEDVNLESPKNKGRHSDGSLKSGRLWVQFDSFDAFAEKVIIIKVYPIEVSNHTPLIQEETTDNDVRIWSGLVDLTFSSSSNYLVSSAKIRGTTTAFRQNLGIGTPTGIKLFKDLPANLIKAETRGNGVIFKEVFNHHYISDYKLEVLLKTRIFKNGTITQTAVFKPTETTSTSVIRSLYNRFGFKPQGTLNVGSGDVFSYGWNENNTNYSVIALNTNGDVKRGSDLVPDLPANIIVNEDFPHVGSMEVMVGWSQGGVQPIVGGKPFTSTIEISLQGYSDSLLNEEVRAMNGIVSQATNKNKYNIFDNMSRMIDFENRNYLSEFNKRRGGITNIYSPAILGELSVADQRGLDELTVISDKFKTIVNQYYGVVTPESLWTKYTTGNVPLQFAGRVFPMAEVFYRRYVELNDTTNAAYYKNLIGSYAEMLCRAYEERGFIGLDYGVGDNANANATGLHGLALGINVFGEAHEPRWVSAYDGNHTHFLEFVKVDNILTDLVANNLSTTHYFSYAVYAMYEYSRACEFRGRVPSFNLTEYINLAVSSYGAIKDYKYNVSSTRRGQPTHSWYSVYLLLKHGSTISDYAVAEKIVENLVEQDNPLGGFKFPLENMWNPSDVGESEYSYSLQIMYHINKFLKELA